MSQMSATNRAADGERATPAAALPSPGGRGDANALLTALFRAHARYIAGIGVRLLGRQEEADDLVQEVFLRAARTPSAVRDPELARAWLRTIAIRLAWRRLKRRRLWHTLGWAGDSLDDQVIDPASQNDDRLMVRDLYRALDRLPVDQRVAWILRHVDGMSLEESAEACRCSLATVKRRLQAAQIALAHVLEPGGHA